MRIKAIDLHEAIAELEMLRIGREEMIILSPVGVMNSVTADELMHGPLPSHLVSCSPGTPDRFHGVLIVTDPMHTRVKVKSLVSGHEVCIPRMSREEAIQELVRFTPDEGYEKALRKLPATDYSHEDELRARIKDLEQRLVGWIESTGSAQKRVEALEQDIRSIEARNAHMVSKLERIVSLCEIKSSELAWSMARRRIKKIKEIAMEQLP